jgi:hypothetical protein
MTVDVALHGAPPASPHAFREWPPDPYKGLNYFTAADAPLFTQRDDDIDEVAALLSGFDLQVLLLHGASGTGKSSFLRAGLIPRLQQSQRTFGRNFCFLREIGRDGSAGDPLLIRATDDPVARIAEALRLAATHQPEVIADAARDRVLAALGGPLPQDRLRLVPAILTALQALTAPPQRDLFILVADQAEEVLTLPPAKEIANAREAFFALIEEICLHRFDLRVIVSLRTEYYGRFCSAFRIQPTHKLTPRTEVRAGMMDHLLAPLRKRQQIAAAIRQPPRSVYGFSYEDDLPEIIAADLLDQTGEASRMAAMQIVCRQLHEHVIRREGRSTITHQDYVRFGRANGVIDAFLVRAIQDAAAAAGLPRLTEQALDSWVLVLSRVVGRTEGSTVQTLIAAEEDLIEEASKRDISAETARAVLGQMVHADRRLLRPAGGETGAPAYSLGHDSLGPALLRIRAAAGVRAAEARVRAEGETKVARERELALRRIKDERSRSRLILAWSMVAIVGLVAAATLTTISWVLPLREKVKLLTEYGSREPTADFRLRLLLLTAALRQSDTASGRWIVDPEAAKAALRQALLRAPIYGGQFAAAAQDRDDHRIVLLDKDQLFVRDLDTGQSSRPFTVPPADDEAAGAPRLSVGSTTLPDGSDALVVYRSNSSTLFVGARGATELVPTEIRFPDAFARRQLNTMRAEISGGTIRLLGLHWQQGAVDTMGVLQIREQPGPRSEIENPGNYLIDWQRLERRAFRLPIVADDCDDYAVLGQGPPGGLFGQKHLTLWLGRLGESARPIGLPAAGGSTVGPSTVAFARGCDAAVVLEGPDRLEVVALDRRRLPAEAPPVLVRVPQALGGFVSPGFLQTPALLAATRMADRQTWRAVRPTAHGLAVIDFAAGPRPSVVRSEVLLTGLDDHRGAGQLKLSRDGRFALLVDQGRPSDGVEVRVYDLDFAARRQSLERLTGAAALEQEACRVAAYQRGDDRLDAGETMSWLDKSAPQPCKGIWR